MPSRPIETILTDLGTRLASRGVDAGLDALAETRVGSTPGGRAALGVVDALIDEWGDDAVEALIRRTHARLERGVDQRGAEAHETIRDAAEEARRRVRGVTDDEGTP